MSCNKLLSQNYYFKNLLNFTMKVETNLLPSSRPTRLSLTQMQCFNSNFSTTLFSWWRKGMERNFDWYTHRNFVSCCALLRRSGIDKSITNECFPHGTFLSPWNMMNHFNDVYQDCTNTDTIVTSYDEEFYSSES